MVYRSKTIDDTSLYPHPTPSVITYPPTILHISSGRESFDVKTTPIVTICFY